METGISVLVGVVALFLIIAWIDHLIARRKEALATVEPSLEPPAAVVPENLPTPPAKLSTRYSDIVFLDVETTGIRAHDRIITFAALKMTNGVPNEAGIYLIFDPRRDSQPEAARVHGWDDWTLRHQDLFATHAQGVHDYLASADLIVMHNAEFDTDMLNREFQKAGLPPIGRECHCTMLRARQHWSGQSASLNACLARIGLSRQSDKHTAFEDAVLVMNLFRFFEGEERPYKLRAETPLPTNFREPPPRPDGDLPRRKPKRAVPRASA